MNNTLAFVMCHLLLALLVVVFVFPYGWVFNWLSKHVEKKKIPEPVKRKIRPLSEYDRLAGKVIVLDSLVSKSESKIKTLRPRKAPEKLETLTNGN